MRKTEIRRFLAVMEFFYGFLFGVAIFGAALTFLTSPNFFLGILFAVCIFAFFIFLTAITRYCIIRIKIAEETLCATLQTQFIQDQILQAMQQTSQTTQQEEYATKAHNLSK